MRHAQASGRARAKAYEAADADAAATSAPSAASIQKWLAVAIDDEGDEQRVDRPEDLEEAVAHEPIAGTAIISAKATCMLGTAANGL